jgi:purine-binding chemotaxis protein CheW
MSDGLLNFADELQRLSSSTEVVAPTPELHLVTFALDREEFGIPIGQVREVIRVGEITRVPQARPHVRGVTNLRGRILAVVEIRTRMGLPIAEITPRSRVVVVGVHDRVLGILVDSVSQVVKVPITTVAPAPEEVLTPGVDYITGVARWNSRLIILLDLEKVLLLSDQPRDTNHRPASSN